MTEQEKAYEDLLLYGQSFMLDGKHIPLERAMIEYDMINYYRAVEAGAEFLNNSESHAPVKLVADLIAAMFQKTNGEVWLDLKAERKEQKKVM